MEKPLDEEIESHLNKENWFYSLFIDMLMIKMLTLFVIQGVSQRNRQTSKHIYILEFILIKKSLHYKSIQLIVSYLILQQTKNTKHL